MVEGPDCLTCGHFADWHHLTPDPDGVQHFACIGCRCSDYVGEIGADALIDGSGRAREG